MSRHVVLLSRDTSLGVALKALLSDRDRVSEIESPRGWRSLNGGPVDVVVVDLPPDLRKAALDALETRFTGPLVVLLDPAEDLGRAAGQERCSVLHRPFGMSELWSLLVASTPAPAAGSAPAAQAGRGPAPTPGASDTEVFPAVESHQVGDWEPAAGTGEPAWRWGRWQFQQPGEPHSVELTESMPAAEADGSVPDAGEAQARLTGAAMWDAIHEAPQAVATRLGERLRADVVALMLDNGEGVLETAGGVGLPPAERRLQVEYGHDVLGEVFRVGVGLIDDTGRVRGILHGLPFGGADTLVMVPLAHEGHGFGVLLAGRYRRRPGSSESEFTEAEIEALMDFAEDVAAALRSAVLLRRLKSQLNLAEGL
ncbi:MAG TPA: GAF domain-containing protein [Actinomycetes bacterium]|jgi:hypothetical protein|nr:GAF domain-containing protein [Actinomycetes bacterium]